jgi:hypothetical protein
MTLQDPAPVVPQATAIKTKAKKREKKKRSHTPEARAKMRAARAKGREAREAIANKSRAELIDLLYVMPTVDPPTAGKILGDLSRSGSYRAAAADTLGVPVFKVGTLSRISSIFILRKLGLPETKPVSGSTVASAPPELTLNEQIDRLIERAPDQVAQRLFESMARSGKPERSAE